MNALPVRRLPPFPELVAFEAVARHLSFTHAAAELCMTQSAMSHRIRRLEAHFGVPLIRRLNPGLALTEAGAALLPELVATLDRLALLGAAPERRVRVAAASALCTWWLAGRLSDFMASRPGVTIELLPIEMNATTIPEVDVRVLWVGAKDDRSRPRQASLFVEQVFPVCSPQLLVGGRPLARAADLQTLPFLHKTRQYAKGEWSWEIWLERLGVDGGSRQSTELRLADMGLLMSAAVDGAGVALTRSLLAHDAMRAGRLMLPLADIEPMPSVKHHVARWPSAKANDPDIAAFVEWLVDQARQTLAATERMIRQPTQINAAPIAG